VLLFNQFQIEEIVRRKMNPAQVVLLNRLRTALDRLLGGQLRRLETAATGKDHVASIHAAAPAKIDIDPYRLCGGAE
jgi:hypothetical protein